MCDKCPTPFYSLVEDEKGQKYITGLVSLSENLKPKIEEPLTPSNIQAETEQPAMPSNISAVSDYTSMPSNTSAVTDNGSLRVSKLKLEEIFKSLKKANFIQSDIRAIQKRYDDFQQELLNELDEYQNNGLLLTENEELKQKNQLLTRENKELKTEIQRFKDVLNSSPETLQHDYLELQKKYAVERKKFNNMHRLCNETLDKNQDLTKENANYKTLFIRQSTCSEDITVRNADCMPDSTDCVSEESRQEAKTSNEVRECVSEESRQEARTSNAVPRDTEVQDCVSEESRQEANTISKVPRIPEVQQSGYDSDSDTEYFLIINETLGQ